MKKILKFVLVCLLCLLAVATIYGFYAIIYPWVTEYNPKDMTVIVEESTGMKKLPTGQDYSILTWNIGYAGLGSDMDFFYEGGSMVRPRKEQTEKYLSGILEFLRKEDSLDFMFIQEVDFRSKRSYRVNQFNAIEEALGKIHGVRAINYKSAFVPSPLAEPMGSVNAGLATFGRHVPAAAYRVATPGAYPWPMRLYMLKRCFLVSRYPCDNGKELVLFNIHNSAFDDASDLRQQELELLKKLASDEYRLGNYVIIGGDWNQNPPFWLPPRDNPYLTKELWPIEGNYMPEGWNWAYDPSLPTNRNVSTPFDRHTTTCTLLDFFLVSPNVQVQDVRTSDLEFKSSDHLPVIMKFRLD